MKKDFVNIGILSFNRLNYTRKCIEAIHETKGNYPFKITVVENGSTDGSVEYLKELYSKKLIDNLCINPKNIGVARGANACWTKEPNAKFFLKLDNDMVPQKVGWLDDMVKFLTKYPDFGTIGYNVEPVSYPLNFTDGEFKVRIKSGNIGGACLLIPKSIENLIGYFNEGYSLYGEEDADYFVRLNARGKHNAYMEDEDAFFHLPAGKAAVIDNSKPGYHAVDGLEEINEKEYRDFKDSCRANNITKLHNNARDYYTNADKTYIKTNMKQDLKFRWFKG